jgi:hypothetical protein
MELRPFWEAVIRSTTQEFPNILWDSKVYYHGHKIPSLAPILGQMNPVDCTQSFLS